MPSDIANALAGVNVFNGLDDNQLETLAGRFGVIECQAGEQLIAEGERGHRLYVIAEGEVEVLLPEDNAAAGRFNDILLARMGPGELFGEYAFIDMRPASASVVARRDCRLLQIDYAELHRILDDHCAIARRFYENLLLVLIDRLRADDRELDVFQPG